MKTGRTGKMLPDIAIPMAFAQEILHYTGLNGMQ